MSQITFITAIFGDRYTPFLCPHIYSIKKVHPDAKNLIYHSRVRHELLNEVTKRFSNIELVEINTDKSDKHDLLNDRMLAWELGAERTDGRAVPIDVDIILLRPIDHFFQKDIVYTYRENHMFPLNLGILLLDNGQRSVEFMRELKTRTSNIFHSSKMAYARKVFGSCDQKAMNDIVKEGKYNIHGVPCRKLNEVECNISEETHAIHYKTSWHAVILDGQKPNFEPRCQKAYDLWLKLNRECKAFMQPLLA